MMSFTASFKLKVLVDAAGRPASGGRDVLKIVVTSGTLMTARASSAAQARFMASLSDLLRNARPASPPPRAGAQLPRVDRGACETLVVMGFDNDRAACALAGTGGDVTRAVQWLQDHQHVPTADLIQQAAQGAPLHTAHASSTVHGRGQMRCGRKGDAACLLTSGRMHAAAPADLPTSLYLQLQQMGYSAGDVDRAAAATRSDDVHTCASWLLDHASSGAATAHATPPAAPAYYPAIRFDGPLAQSAHGGAHPGAAPLASHPVAVQDSARYGGRTTDCDGETTANPAAGYYPAVQAPRAAPQRRAPAKPMGMAGVIYQKRQETEAATSQVHQGFRDLEVRLSLGS